MMVFSQSPWYQYWEGEDQHIVWFEDIRSYSEKYKLMDQYQLLGTTFWQLSLQPAKLGLFKK